MNRCAYCGTETRNAKYCTNICQGAERRAREHERIDATGWAPRPMIAKRYLAEKFGRQCSICGLTTWMGQPAPLVLDHIDGDGLNHKIENLRLVCGNCDMQLPTYKSKNWGRGRVDRRLRAQLDARATRAAPRGGSL